MARCTSLLICRALPSSTPARRASRRRSAGVSGRPSGLRRASNISSGGLQAGRRRSGRSCRESRPPPPPARPRRAAPSAHAARAWTGSAAARRSRRSPSGRPARRRCAGPGSVTGQPSSGSAQTASPGTRKIAGSAISPVKRSTPSQTCLASRAKRDARRKRQRDGEQKQAAEDGQRSSASTADDDQRPAAPRP